jgi:hypothetical protein
MSYSYPISDMDNDCDFVSWPDTYLRSTIYYAVKDLVGHFSISSHFCVMVNLLSQLSNQLASLPGLVLAVIDDIYQTSKGALSLRHIVLCDHVCHVFILLT